MSTYERHLLNYANTLKFISASQRGALIAQVFAVSTSLGRLTQEMCADMKLRVEIPND